jgi:peptidyl-prolyl cis-trans isomerase C
MKVRVVCGALLAVISGFSCGDRTQPPSAEQAALGGEVAARVGTDVIPMSLVIKVASVQHVTPREALRRLIDDAVSANAARARGLDRQPPISWRLTAARGRVMADRLLAEAKVGGPPTDEEVAQLTARYWREVDRPAAIRVVHMVAMRPKKPDPVAEANARAFASQAHDALVSAKNSDDFQQMAKALPHPGVEVVVQPLPAFGPDGVVTEGGDGSMDEAFAKASHALGDIGSTSPVVESKFGWHVIRLEERIPEQRMPLEARRVAFTDEAYALRAGAATATLLKARRSTTPIEVAPSAEQVMRSLVDTAGHGPTP